MDRRLRYRILPALKSGAVGLFAPSVTSWGPSKAGGRAAVSGIFGFSVAGPQSKFLSLTACVPSVCHPKMNNAARLHKSSHRIWKSNAPAHAAVFSCGLDGHANESYQL